LNSIELASLNSGSAANQAAQDALKQQELIIDDLGDEMFLEDRIENILGKLGSKTKVKDLDDA